VVRTPPHRVIERAAPQAQHGVRGEPGPAGHAEQLGDGGDLGGQQRVDGELDRRRGADVAAVVHAGRADGEHATGGGEGVGAPPTRCTRSRASTCGREPIMGASGNRAGVAPARPASSRAQSG
jgi:hypothetical protein